MPVPPGGFPKSPGPPGPPGPPPNKTPEPTAPPGTPPKKTSAYLNSLSFVISPKKDSLCLLKFSSYTSMIRS